MLNNILLAIVPVAIGSLYFAYRTYSTPTKQRRGAGGAAGAVDSLDEGICVLDDAGRVTLWNDAIERLLGCRRDGALGRTLVDAVPALAQANLSKALNEAVSSQRPLTISPVALPSSAGQRFLQIKALPAQGGVRLYWQDVTERVRAELAFKRSEERFALAAAGANDGLWEWDLRSQEMYFSERWKSLMGLPPKAGTGSPDDWFERVHADDLAPLKDALDAYLSGTLECLQHEHRIRHEDGTYRWVLCRGVAARAAGQRPTRLAGSLTDTTDRALAQERLRGAGFHDPLTGLANRAVFVELLGHRLHDFKARRGGRFAVLYLDLDRFKVVNDSLGHMVGDELLVDVSRRLESCLREGDALARLGGDEFAILLQGLNDEQQANAITLRIQDSLHAPFPIGGREVFTSASIGIAFSSVEYVSPEEMMRDADTAMYHAKAHGKARHELFDADMHAKALDRLGLENDLRRAVNAGDFEVHYQPIVALATGLCKGFEALIRWNRDGKVMSPAKFIPVAEELGLIEPIGTWVLHEACRTFADWQRRFPDSGLECITVNVSTRQLMQPSFVRIVEQVVHRAKMKPADLRLEITETTLMDSPHVAAEVLRDLREYGVKIYLDDFGTGYSSLSHLHKLPVDALKIDRSFVGSLLLDDRPAIVESILALARTLNTSVVAEGVETEVQAIELHRLGCRHAQGYYFSRPLAAKAVEDILIAGEPLGKKGATTPAQVNATVKHPDLYFSPASFEWPEDVPVRTPTARSA